MRIECANRYLVFRIAPGYSKHYVGVRWAPANPFHNNDLSRLYPEEMKRLAKSYCPDSVGGSYSISEAALIKVFLSCFPSCFCNLPYNWTIYFIRQ